MNHYKTHVYNNYFFFMRFSFSFQEGHIDELDTKKAIAVFQNLTVSEILPCIHSIIIYMIIIVNFVMPVQFSDLWPCICISFLHVQWITQKSLTIIILLYGSYRGTLLALCFLALPVKQRTWLWQYSILPHPVPHLHCLLKGF